MFILMFLTLIGVSYAAGEDGAPPVADELLDIGDRLRMGFARPLLRETEFKTVESHYEQIRNFDRPTAEEAFVRILSDLGSVRTDPDAIPGQNARNALLLLRVFVYSDWPGELKDGFDVELYLSRMQAMKATMSLLRDLIRRGASIRGAEYLEAATVVLSGLGERADLASSQSLLTPRDLFVVLRSIDELRLDPRIVESSETVGFHRAFASLVANVLSHASESGQPRTPLWDHLHSFAKGIEEGKAFREARGGKPPRAGLP